MAFIFILEDDYSLGRSLSDFLEAKGYSVEWCRDLKTGIGKLKDLKAELFLLDWNLPDGTGLDFLKMMGEHRSKPVFFLTAKDDEDSAVLALSEGACDYLRKPFGTSELLIKIKKAIHEAHNPVEKIRCGDLEVDLKGRVAFYKGEEVQLRRKELDILVVLIRKADQVVSREEMLSKVDSEGNIYDRTIDSYVSRLRKILEKSKVRDLELVSVYGEGYQLKKKAA